MYYLLSSFGVLLGLIIAVLRVKIKWFSLPVFLYLALNILSFFVVSKLFGLLSYGIHLINRGALSFARLWNETGYIIWGAIIGFSLSAILLAKKFKIKKKDAYLISALIITSFHWMAKLGCFHAGCCYGIISDSTIAMLPVTSIGPVVERIPVQLIESIIVFIIWCIIILFSFSQRLHKHTLSFYLFIYAITRFVLEFFRGDYTRGKIGCFYFSQWISISVLLVIIVIYIFMFIKKINQRSKKNEKKFC